MNGSDRMLARSQYLAEVGRLLSDLDDDERASLLADLGDRLEEITDAEIEARLGTPGEFVDEYRRSAGVELVARGEGRPEMVVQNVLSALLLPFGALVLLSFGGQVVFGPFVVAIEWVLARISSRPLRIAWSVLAGALVGEITYLLIDFSGTLLRAVAVSIGVATGVVAGVLIYRTATVRQ